MNSSKRKWHPCVTDFSTSFSNGPSGETEAGSKAKKKMMGLVSYSLILLLTSFVIKPNEALKAAQLTSFGYRLPADSYALFQLNHRVSTNQEEFFPEKLQKNNPRQARQVQISTCHYSKDLEATFPKCWEPLKECQMEDFGHCLVAHYPETRDMTSSSSLVTKMSSSSINPALLGFHNDDEACTEFVRQFFVKCRTYIHSCQAMRNNQVQALPMLGCLFAHYSELMLPLFHARILHIP